MKTFLRFAVLAGVLVACGRNSPEVYTTADGAIGGYDPVAFFVDSAAVKGSEELSYSWNGATWRFSSAANLERFRETPEKFAPQYGGYCAYGTAGGYKAPTQADTWTIANGKLYFNYNNEVKTEWLKDQTEFIREADDNWPEVKKK